MTDKEILGTIYRWIQQSNSRDENPDHTRQRLKDFQGFIEQEWQRQDDAKSLGQFSDTWYKDDKRHRGLEIEPDGTVSEVK